MVKYFKLRAQFPKLSHPQVRENSRMNEVVYVLLVKFAFNFNLCISFSFHYWSLICSVKQALKVAVLRFVLISL